MSDEQFPYDDWVTDAMRGVLRRALETLAVCSAPGDHHFYINFRTTDPEVGLPGFLKAQYPEEITIVLQHQFEDLHVDDTGLDVTLSFSGQRHRLSVPFAAVTSFADPSVNFGLQIGPQVLGAPDLDAGDETGAYPAGAPTGEPGENVTELSGDKIAQNADVTGGDDQDNDSGSNEASDATSGEPSDGGADVISIEAFRNK